MEIVDFAKIDKKQWDDFCFSSESAWFRHTSSWLGFAQDLSKSNVNISFAVFKDKKILAIMPIFIEFINGKEDKRQFGLAGMGAPFPAFENLISDEERKGILKMIFDKIDDIAKREKISYSHFFIDPLTNLSLRNAYLTNPLLEFGLHDTSLTTNVIDLSADEDDILRGMRKGHSSDIKFIRKSKDNEVCFFAKDNITDRVWGEYKNIYFSAAGRVVGDENRWGNILNFIRDGNAHLVMLRRDGKYITGIVNLDYKNCSYYFLGATLPEFQRERGIGHLVQWENIKYLKDRGLKNYETGWNFTEEISEDVYTPKEVNISHFKSGFGGHKLPFLRGERFYDPSYQYKRRVELEERFKTYYTKSV